MAPPLQDPVVEAGPGWLCLRKPAGLPVLPPHADPAGDCLLARLLAAHPAQARSDWPQGFAGGILHRLDVPTSGMVLAATSPDDLVRFRSAFADRALDKRYRFLTRRSVAWTENSCDRPLAHDRRRKARMVVQRGQNTPHRGRWLPAATRFVHLGEVRGEPGEVFGLWEARMQSGVMHQVRVHAGFVGLALAGDRLYGGGEPTPWALAHAEQAGLATPPFHLHHVGLVGPGLAPTPLPVPGWWPPT